MLTDLNSMVAKLRQLDLHCTVEDIIASDTSDSLAMHATFRVLTPSSRKRKFSSIDIKPFDCLGSTVLGRIRALLAWFERGATVHAVLDNEHPIHRKIKAAALPSVVTSVHLFFSKEGGPSFSRHKDSEDVVLYVESGEKCIHFDDHAVTLSAKDYLYLPKGTYHWVTNVKDTLLYSVGVDRGAVLPTEEARLT